MSRLGKAWTPRPIIFASPRCRRMREEPHLRREGQLSRTSPDHDASAPRGGHGTTGH